jgi:hypothetical protein
MGPQGATGPAGTIDYTQVIGNQTTQQPTSNFNISGNGTMASLTVSGTASIGAIAADSNLSVAGGGNSGVRIGDAQCGPGYAGIGLFAPMATCSNYTFLGAATGNPDLFINRPSAGTIHFRMNNTEQASIDTTGALHVASNNPSGCDLLLADDTCFYDEQNGTLSVRNSAGTAYIPIKAQAFNVVSTIALKKDVTALGGEDYERMLSTIEALPLYTYRYKSEESDAPIHTGLIAESSPMTVLEPDGKGVDIYDLVSVNVGATKALAAKSDALESRVRTLSDDNARLAQENVDLRARLERLERTVERLGAER